MKDCDERKPEQRRQTIPVVSYSYAPRIMKSERKLMGAANYRKTDGARMPRNSKPFYVTVYVDKVQHPNVNNAERIAWKMVKAHNLEPCKRDPQYVSDTVYNRKTQTFTKRRKRIVHQHRELWLLPATPKGNPQIVDMGYRWRFDVKVEANA